MGIPLCILCAFVPATYSQHLIWFRTLSLPRSSVCVFPSASVNNSKRMILNIWRTLRCVHVASSSEAYVYFTLVYNKTEKQTKSRNADSRSFFLVFFYAINEILRMMFKDTTKQSIVSIRTKYTDTTGFYACCMQCNHFSEYGRNK